MRQLKYHEQKLLKKVDFFQWKSENKKESTIASQFHLNKTEEYVKYNKICGRIAKIANLISTLQPDDPFRQKIASQLLDKLYTAGLISSKNSITQLTHVTATTFCKRRLASVLVALKMCQHLKEAITLIQHGHVRIGPDVVKDPSFFVTREMEDFVTWVDHSKIKRKISTYYNSVDDYDMMN